MSDTIEKTFSTPDGCELVVKNVHGTIDVSGWDRPETQVTAVRHQEWAEVEIYQEGRQIVARTRDEHNLSGIADLFTRGHVPTVDYTVHVPFASDLKLRTVNGSIQVTQIQGDVRVNSVDGKISLQAIKGSVKSETVNGPLHASHLEGKAKLNAVNGQLAVQDSVLSSLQAETVNGQIQIGTTLNAEGKYAFHTVNGSCHLTIPANASATVSVHGINAHVECALPACSVERSMGSWRGTIGQGEGPKAEITLHTVNGNLHLQAAGTDAQFSPVVDTTQAETPEPPEPPEPPEHVVVKVAQDAVQDPALPQPTLSKAEILGKIERGEMSVQEALERLQSLG